MTVNVFKGARRISVLLGAAWVIGCVASIAFANRALYLNYEVSSFGSAPKLATGCDYHSDASQMVMRSIPPDVESTGVNLCFKASKADNGQMLVPYMRQADGRIWMNEALSSPVLDYTQKVASTFDLDQAGLADINTQKATKRKEQWIETAKVVFGGLAVGWILIFLTGWVVRGFMGIPLGRDFRVDLQPPTV